MSNPNNRMSGYRGSSTDPRMSQYQMRPQQPRPNSRSQQPQSGVYHMDNMARPPRPPSHQQQQQRPYSQQQRHQQAGYPNQQQQHHNSRMSREPTYQSSRQPNPQRIPPPGGRPMRPPPHGSPMVPGSTPNQAQGPYRRVSMNRSRSLSRPERQRPRQGMFRSPSQQRQQMMMYGPNGHPQNGGGNAGPPGYMNARPRPSQPMPNRLQQQLQQQKIQQQQQQQALLSGPGPNQPINNNNKKEDIPEEKVKVLTNWWAWTAFLMTCCIPNWFLRVCLRKKNPMVQQAWREKVW